MFAADAPLNRALSFAYRICVSFLSRNVRSRVFPSPTDPSFLLRLHRFRLLVLFFRSFPLFTRDSSLNGARFFRRRFFRAGEPVSSQNFMHSIFRVLCFQRILNEILLLFFFLSFLFLVFRTTTVHSLTGGRLVAQFGTCVYIDRSCPINPLAKPFNRRTERKRTDRAASKRNCQEGK